MNTGVVARPRLLGRLASRFDRRVTMIVAGAGFGKTTLVHQAIAEVDPDANALDVVVPVSRRGIDGPRLMRELLDQLGAIAVTDPTTDAVCAAVWSRAPREVCLVIDDAQWLTADAVELLAELVESLPRTGHLLIASREELALPIRTVLHAREIEHLVESDLAFDADELHAYAVLHGHDPTAFASRWPALVELERLSGRSGAIRYLVDEVFGAMQPDRLHACRLVAVHPVVDDDTIDAATTFPGDAQTLLRDVPLTTASDQGFGLHELIREALTDGLDANARADAQVAIGTRLAHRGEHDAALELFASAGRSDRIRWLARLLAAQLHVGDPTDARRMLISRVRELLGDTVEAAVADAIALGLEDPARALSALDVAAGRARRSGDAELEASCMLHLADVAYGAADLARVSAAADRLEELAATGEPLARRIGFLPQVWVRSLTDRHAEVVELVDQRRRALAPGADPELEQLLALYRVMNLGYIGHVRDALAEAEALSQLPGGLFANRLAGFTVIQRWQLGQLDATARAEVGRLLDQIEAHGQFHLFVEGAATTALFHASAGQTALASDLVDRAQRHLHRLADTAWAHHTVAQARAVLALLDGDEHHAAAILDEAIPDAGIATLPRFIYGATATLSYVLVPRTRATWEADRCGPDHELRRDIGRALVALRERHDLTLAAALPWDQRDRLRPWAYEPHLAELALAALDAGVGAARTSIDSLSHDPHRTLTDLANCDDHPVASRAAALVRSLPRRPAGVLGIDVLGPLVLHRDQVPVVDERWDRRQRVRDLMAVLVDRRRVERSALVELLWPDKPAESAASNLRFTLSQLLAVLEPDRLAAEPSWFIRSQGSRLELTGGDRLVIDVERFDALIRSARTADRAGSPQRALEQYLAACDVYRGDYLAGASQPDWGFYEGLRLRGMFLDAATRATDLLASIGELDAAESLASRAAATEPFHEGAGAALAKVLLIRRRPTAARDVLTVLIGELERAGLEPDPTTSDLARRVGLHLPTATPLTSR